MRLLLCGAALLASLNVVVAEDKPAGPSLKVVWTVDKGLATPESTISTRRRGFCLSRTLMAKEQKKTGTATSRS